MMHEADRQYLELLKDNNTQLKKIADALETLTLHYIDSIGKPEKDSNEGSLSISTFVPEPITRDKQNPLHYIKSHEEADAFVQRCIDQAKSVAPDELLIGSRSITKLLRHEYNIPEQQILLLNPGLDNAFKHCGLRKVGKQSYLIEEVPAKRTGGEEEANNEQGSTSVLQEA